jgi:hypothetical protein
MVNPFSLLPVDDDDTSFTANLPRKLNKMKRRYKANPTEDLRNRIDELEKRLIPIPPNPNDERKKNKKPIVEINLEEEYRKNRDYWRRENERVRVEQEKKKRNKDYEDIMNREQAKRRKKMKEEQKKQQEQQHQWRYHQQRTELFRKQEKYVNLPQDIRDFLQINILDKDNVPKDVKKLYNKLCLRYHPDKGGNVEHFKVINNHIN